MENSLTRFTAILLLGTYLLSIYLYFPAHSADLMSTWLAGKFLAHGQPDQVYPQMTDMFRMYPPTQWRGYMAAEYQYSGELYPFLYPPIWAKVGELASAINFWRLTAIATMVNTALLFATPLLAFRAVRPNVNQTVFVGLGIFFLLSTHIGTIALQQNQPQILVSFLLVLTVERLRNGAPILAGLALAIAAAIKIYPAFFALLLLFGRDWKALASFAISGTVLGLVSVAWAGWPLHQAFLDQIRLISSTVMVTGITFNLDATIAQLFFLPDLTWVPAQQPATPVNPNPGWYAMARPEIWRMVSTALLIGSFALLSRATVRVTTETKLSLIWPLALIVVSLLAPISWVYYYIPAACFAPVLLDKLGRTQGAIFLMLSFGPIFGPVIKVYRLTQDFENWPPYLYSIIAVLALSLLCFGYILAIRRSVSDKKQPI